MLPVQVFEGVVAKQLTSHINNNKLDNPHQSAYKPGHTTESALLSIKEVHLSLVWGEATALVLLDLSSFITLSIIILSLAILNPGLVLVVCLLVVCLLPEKLLSGHQDRFDTV